MKYIATIEDQTFEIEINGEQEIIVDGKPFEADFNSVADQPVYSLLLNGHSYEASVYSLEAVIQVLLRGQLYDVLVEDERQRRLRETSGGLKVEAGEFHLKAPMPGMIVAVPVEEGQEVTKGQHLIILESMKMQNELKAPRDGVIRRLSVKPGDSVDQDATLLTLD